MRYSIEERRWEEGKTVWSVCEDGICIADFNHLSQARKWLRWITPTWREYARES